MIERNYPQPWQPIIFRPIAWLETHYRGVDIELTCHAAPSRAANPQP